MKRYPKRLNSVLLMLILFSLLVGCAAHKVTSYETSGFLKSYAGLEEGTKDQPNLVYINPSIDLKSYDKILIDQVVVFFNRQSQNKGVDPEQLLKLTNYFHKALVNELQNRFTIVDKPGEGVLRIRTAITDVEPGHPAGNAVSSVVPVGIAISVIKKTTTDTNMGVGRASMEIEIVDSLSGSRLAAAIDRREGGKKIVSGKWTAIEESFEYWAKKLGVFLTKHKGI